MGTKGLEYYSVQVGDAFLSSLPTDMMQTYNMRRSVTSFNTVLETGSIKRYIPQKLSFDMNREIGGIIYTGFSIL